MDIQRSGFNVKWGCCEVKNNFKLQEKAILRNFCEMFLQYFVWGAEFFDRSF
jgi:hypothetical protein